MSHAVSVDALGIIYLASGGVEIHTPENSWNMTLGKYARDGSLITRTFGDPNTYPYIPAESTGVDAYGNILAGDWDSGLIHVISTEGEIVTTFSLAAASDTETPGPNGFAFDADGKLYITDWRNDCVKVYQPVLY